ncbi:hypothetical protein FGO68_gene1968 [Halteria grandinella]|uniref:Uncharacterized protein n=1 Tax=Halteria grandinella TaxID=5974 RepID=A0A8J8NSX1_HALGN|nr:hypothetical protein FGO68_gene1968 [Halteria grandinella]
MIFHNNCSSEQQHYPINTLLPASNQPQSSFHNSFRSLTGNTGSQTIGQNYLRGQGCVPYCAPHSQACMQPVYAWTTKTTGGESRLYQIGECCTSPHNGVCKRFKFGENQCFDKNNIMASYTTPGTDPSRQPYQMKQSNFCTCNPPATSKSIEYQIHSGQNNFGLIESQQLLSTCTDIKSSQSNLIIGYPDKNVSACTGVQSAGEVGNQDTWNVSSIKVAELQQSNPMDSKEVSVQMRERKSSDQNRGNDYIQQKFLFLPPTTGGQQVSQKASFDKEEAKKQNYSWNEDGTNYQKKREVKGLSKLLPFQQSCIVQKSSKRVNNRISCETKVITEGEGIDVKQYLYYECQLVKVNKDRKGPAKRSKGKDTPFSGKRVKTRNEPNVKEGNAHEHSISEGEVELEQDFARIIFDSNLMQLKKVIQEAKEKCSGKEDQNPIIFRGLKDFEPTHDFESDPQNPFLFKEKAELSLESSQYRGVSINGKKWQVMVMGNKCKYFSGSIPYHALAARIYDRFALQHFGLRSRINLTYSLQELEDLVEEIEEQITDQLIAIKEERSKEVKRLCSLQKLSPSDVIILKGRLPLKQV